MIALIAATVLAASTEFTRTSAVRYALEHNPDLLAAQAQVKAAKSHFSQASARPNPNLAGQVQGFNPNNQSQLQISLGITQTWPWSGQNRHKQAMAEEELQEATLGAESVGLSTVLNTKQGYNQALSARQALVLAQENLRWNEELARMAEDKVKVGELAPVEVLRAQVAVAQARRDELCAQRDFEQALTQLRLVMGRMEPISLRPDGDLILTSLPTLEVLVKKGLAHRPEVALAASNLRHEAANERLIRAGILPGADFTIGGQTSGGSPGMNFGINLGLPVWYRQDGELAQSSATQEALRLNQVSAEHNLRAQIEQAYLQVRSAESQIRLYQDHLLPEARHLVEQMRQRFQFGDASGRDLQESRKGLREAQNAFNRSVLDYRNAIANLEASTGEELGVVP